MKIHTILSPQLFSLFEKEVVDKQVLVIDILRATTSMVVMLENGATSVRPVAGVEEALRLKQENPALLIAGERNGFKVEGFEFGNSPQEFTPERVRGESLVITTTNGTQALSLSLAASHIWVGGFLNMNALVASICDTKKDVFLFCAGWKGHVNLEDTLFAGAVAQQLVDKGWAVADDATRAAMSLWLQAQGDLHGFLSEASHVQRFQSMHAESDLDVCLKCNTSGMSVRYENGVLVAIPS
ncbi:MAG: 2-phosphosulfolactate phosphatase [Bacteroidetes bacterium]|nr:2-phosphosulfolactate phosphatase [Bacteroidota bacterium]